MNFIHLIERAISTQPEDHSVLKEFFNREYRKAERDHFYTKESFFNGLLEVLTRKKILIRKKFDNRKTDLEKIINKIDTYIVPYPQISDIPFDEINMDEYRKDKRNKLLKQSKEELKDITIYNYKNNIAPFAKVELIEKVINELFKETIPETEPHTKPGRPKAVIHDASYYLYNKGLLQFLIDNYSNIKAHIFNQLIKALIDLGQLKTASNKEYKEAFGNALNIKQSQTNFDNAIKNATTTIFEPIKTKIATYLEQQIVV